MQAAKVKLGIGRVQSIRIAKYPDLSQFNMNRVQIRSSLVRAL